MPIEMEEHVSICIGIHFSNENGKIWEKFASFTTGRTEASQAFVALDLKYFGQVDLLCKTSKWSALSPVISLRKSMLVS